MGGLGVLCDIRVRTGACVLFLAKHGFHVLIGSCATSAIVVCKGNSVHVLRYESVLFESWPLLANSVL